MKRRIILLGPPASGKGTIAARLQERFDLRHVSSGHLLRREVEKDSPVGRQIKSFLEQGELAPDDTVLQFMKDWFAATSLENGFVLDGFPRTPAQGKALDDWLAERGWPIQAVILFTCPLGTILDRITGRRSCPKCGRVYHVSSAPPMLDGQCDECKVALTRREDDTESVVRKRFEIYRRLTEPLVGYYERSGRVTALDAELTPEDRFAKTVAALN